MGEMPWMTSWDPDRCGAVYMSSAADSPSSDERGSKVPNPYLIAASKIKATTKFREL